MNILPTGGVELVGVVECRLEPLHKGHVLMIHTALGMLEEAAFQRGAIGYTLHVIVCSHDGEILPGHKRFEWAELTFGGNPHIKVHSAHNALEWIPGYGSDYNAHGYTGDWTFWGKVATDMVGLGHTIDYVYGSEDYVHGIAAACGAESVMIDADRSTMQVSGTIVRNSPYDNWDSFPDAVKSFFTKRICIIGGPYTGKAELAEKLALHYHTPFVCDVSDTIYNPDERKCTADDLERIAIAHTIRAEALRPQANRVLLSDSDTLLTALWYQELFGELPIRLQELADTQRFDLYLFCDSANVPFRPSNSFQDEASWHAFSDTIKRALTARSWPFVCLSDIQQHKRFSQAVLAINALRWEADSNEKVGWYQPESTTVPGSVPYRFLE